MVGNGWSIPVFECDNCFGEMADWIEYNEQFICPDCAFRLGIISDKEYIDLVVPSVWKDKARACIYEGKILIAFGKELFPFEMETNDDYRHSKQYQEWRSQVFERDNFKCQVCGQVGGKLNAHHIKTFKDYPDLRFELSNGITLCEKCHRDLHKRIRYAGKKNVHKKNNRE